MRIELTTPGLRDQCSIHWAMEATVAHYVESVGVILAKNVHKAMMNWAKPLVSLPTVELVSYDRHCCRDFDTNHTCSFFFFFNITKLCVPRRGIEPRPRRWERRILTTRPPGRSGVDLATVQLNFHFHCGFLSSSWRESRKTCTTKVNRVCFDNMWMRNS